jgi:pilus assembly protein CpaF
MSGFGRKDKGENTPPTENPQEKHVENDKIVTSHDEDQPQYTSPLSDPLKKLREQIFEKLITEIDFRKALKMSRSQLKEEVEKFTNQFSEIAQIQLSRNEQGQISEDIVNDLTGLGPVEALLKDDKITDILINGANEVYIERFGKLEKTNIKFRDERHVLQVAQRIVSQIGRRVDESTPLANARLKDGSRVNIIIPPISLDGTSISIRRFSEKRITLEHMAEKGNLSFNMLKFLEICSRCRLNIIVSGGTGAGKTTLLNALSHLIDPKERIVTIEDAAELRLSQPHVVRLESRPPNIEGQGEVTIRDLVKNSLRMRPDRIIVGECRSSETFDMLQAMNTGHDGSMSTLHANNALEALNRLENMVLMAGFELPVDVIKGYIVGAIDLIVHVARMRDGVRRVVQIMDVIDLVDKKIVTRPIFNFRPTGSDEHDRVVGVYECLTKNISFLPKIEYFGLKEQIMQSLE